MQKTKMNYRDALEIAGAKVLDFQEFGTNQGDWFAIVLHKGTKRVVKGAFGSCSGCDAFEEAWNYRFSKHLDDGEMNVAITEFITPYLEDVVTIEDAIKYAEKDIDWDLDAKDMVLWLKALQKIHFEQQLDDILNDRDA